MNQTYMIFMCQHIDPNKNAAFIEKQKQLTQQKLMNIDVAICKNKTPFESTNISHP